MKGLETGLLIVIWLNLKAPLLLADCDLKVLGTGIAIAYWVNLQEAPIV